MWHEQSSADRDAHLEVHLDRVTSEARFNFNKLKESMSWVGYDYDSVTHYSRASFAVSSRAGDVLEAIDGRTAKGRPIVNEANTAKLGQRVELSVKDAVELQIMYHCHLTNATASQEENAPPDDIKDLCTESCPCAEHQGGCVTDTQCNGALYCGEAYGFYEHLGQRVAVPDLNACLNPTLKPSYPPVTPDGRQGNATLAPSIAPAPTTSSPSIPGEEPGKDLSLLMICGAIVGISAVTGGLSRRRVANASRDSMDMNHTSTQTVNPMFSGKAKSPNSVTPALNIRIDRDSYDDDDSVSTVSTRSKASTYLEFHSKFTSNSLKGLRMPKRKASVAASSAARGLEEGDVEGNEKQQHMRGDDEYNSLSDDDVRVLPSPATRSGFHSIDYGVYGQEPPSDKHRSKRPTRRDRSTTTTTTSTRSTSENRRHRRHRRTGTTTKESRSKRSTSEHSRSKQRSRSEQSHKSKTAPRESTLKSYGTRSGFHSIDLRKKLSGLGTRSMNQDTRSNAPLPSPGTRSGFHSIDYSSYDRDDDVDSLL
jgi:hypothetical protein